MIIRKSPQEIERMARAGEVVADVLALLGERARPGVTTEELDALADEFIRYGGFSQANSRALGGTSVLIVVGVALDTMRQMESQMMMRSYEGFLK